MGYLPLPRAEALRRNYEPQKADGNRLTLSVRDAAACIGVSTTTLYRLFDDKQLPWIKVRGRRVVRLEAIRKYLEANEVGGAA